MQMDSRVQDFLDDKLQSAADLESIDSLLENVKAQQDLLKKQVRFKPGIVIFLGTDRSS